MSKGAITIASLITASAILFGSLGLGKWVFYDPLNTNIDKVNDRIDGNEAQIGTAIETLGRMDERLKATAEQVKWLVQRFGYIEPRQSSTSPVSTTQ